LIREDIAMTIIGSVCGCVCLFVGTVSLGAMPKNAALQNPTLAVHVISAEQLVTVIVKIRVGPATKKSRPKYFTLHTVPGFSVEGCDVLTMFDAVNTYEDNKARGIDEEIEVFVGKDHYDGDLRFFGVYPLGYNLACIQIQRKGSGAPQLHVFPLEKNRAYEGLPAERDISKHTLLGTPFVNAAGNIVSVLTQRPNDVSGIGILVTASQIQSFLDALADESPHGVPHLNHRPLIIKPSQ
jgi:hypothetical protein